MNDPGLDEPISNDAENVEHQKRDEKEEAEEDEETFLEPRYAKLPSISAIVLFSSLSSKFYSSNTNGD
jgi:hypothetical protein